MKPYENYKDSGVDWAKDFPFHWDLVKAKYVYEKKFLPPQENDGVVTCFRDGEVTLRSNRRMSGFTEADKEHGYQHVDIGDLVIHGMDAFAGAVGVSDSSGKMSPVCNICQAKIEVNNIYYGYIVREMAVRGYILSLYRGIRERSSDFRFETFSRQYLPLPPKREQDKIVAFIGEKATSIDTLISDKEKLLTLLAEERQAIISEAVTKGLDPLAEMKDSGLSYILKIPSHWIVLKAKYVFQRKTIPSYDTDEIVTCFRDGEVTLRKNRRTSGFTEADKEFGYQHVENGDLVIHVMDAFAGAVGVSDSIGKISPVCSICEPIITANNHYFAYFIREMALRGFISSLAKGIRERSTDFRFGTFAKQFLFVPPVEEQNEIVSYLDKKNQKLDQITADTKEQIKLLKEYRQSLISEVVTGKIEV